MKRAVIYILAAAAAICGGGWAIDRVTGVTYGHGLYCAVGTAATVGCDVGPHTAKARLIFVAVIVVCIPLFALAYGSLSSAHLRRHMDLHRRATVAQVRHELDAAAVSLRTAVDESSAGLHRALDRHAQNLLDRQDVHAAALRAHVSAVAAGAQANAGAGSSPASQGSDAGERAVPPAAATSARKAKGTAAPPPGA